jgi:hypothetical protein
MSKGKNKTSNALQQCLRLEYNRTRAVHLAEDIAKRTAEEAENIEDAAAAAAAASGVALRGRCTFTEALGNFKPSEIARICHVIRERVKTLAGEEHRVDYDSLVQLIPALRPTAAGFKDCVDNMMAAGQLQYYAKATIYRGTERNFSIRPRHDRGIGSGVSVKTSGPGSDCLEANELLAIVRYETNEVDRDDPSFAQVQEQREKRRRRHRKKPRRCYIVAIVRSLQPVLARTCVLKADSQHPHIHRGMEVVLKRGHSLVNSQADSDSDSVDDVRELLVSLPYNRRYIRIKADLLKPVTAEGRANGIHHVMQHCGVYMQYGLAGCPVHVGSTYEALDEIEAICPRTTIDSQVCLVSDRGGTDPLGRPRFFWYKQLYHH